MKIYNEENVKKITPYIHSGSLNVTNTVISVHNYTTDSLYLNSIEKVYYKDSDLARKSFIEKIFDIDRNAEDYQKQLEA